MDSTYYHSNQSAASENFREFLVEKSLETKRELVTLEGFLIAEFHVSVFIYLTDSL